MGRLIAAALGAVAVAACSQRAREVRQEAALRELVQQRIPGVERATGLRFKTSPKVARRTRDQVRDYLVNKLDAELPPPELAALESAYKLFGFIADSVNLRTAMLKVYGEQIAGYYDPDSTMLFVVADVDSFLLRTTLSHELVHALQHQYLPLDSLIRQKRQNDRARAAQSVLEGQATLAQTIAMMPELKPQDLPSFWNQRTVVNEQQEQMKEFVGAPLWLRETLVFPYLAGADFVRWYQAKYPAQHPFDRAMPLSTEQILHVDRYAMGDLPVTETFNTPARDTVRYEDGLGELEIRLLFQQYLRDMTGERATPLAQGWGGDRFQVLGADTQRLALVWYTVWDDTAAADRFQRSLTRIWRPEQRPGRSSRIERLSLDGRPGVRLVDAPPEWPGWSQLPTVKTSRTR